MLNDSSEVKQRDFTEQLTGHRVSRVHRLVCIVIGSNFDHYARGNSVLQINKFSVVYLSLKITLLFYK